MFPPMPPEDYEDFKLDIAENGQQVPAVSYKGLLLDGKHRDRACTELGIETKFIEWDGKGWGGSPTLYVVSANRHRRHMTASQLAMVGAKMIAHLQSETQTIVSHISKTSFPANLSSGLISTPPIGRASEIAAAAVGTSKFSVTRGEAVMKAGIPELIAAVDAGQVAVDNAYEIAKLPPEDQLKSVAKGEEGMLRDAQELRKQRKASKPTSTSSDKPIAARGVSAVVEYLDGRVEHWARSGEPYAERLFDEARKVRLDLCGR